MNKKVDEALQNVDLAFENSITVSEIQERLTKYGFTPEKMDYGKELHGFARQSNEIQAKEAGELQGASQIMAQEMDVAKAIYRKHFTIAGIALKDDNSVVEALAMKGRRKISVTGLVAQGKLFYSNIQTSRAWMSAMAEFGISPDDIKAGQDKMLNLEKSWYNYNKEKGESQEATKVRDAKIDELMEWYRDFKSIARIALEDKPQYLEMLGIVEPS